MDIITNEKSIIYSKFHKETFEKISEKRRKKVLAVAISEFAENGFNATNINVIAKKAGISIGSMYSYFASKEDLFLTIIEMGFRLLENALSEVNVDEGDLFEQFEQLLRIGQKYAKTYPEMNQIYIDVTTQGLSSLANRLSYKLEAITKDLYHSILERAKKTGIIKDDLNSHILSFCFDNLIIMFQFSFASDYYRERMKIFLGDDLFEDEDKVIQGIVDFVRKALTN